MAKGRKFLLAFGVGLWLSTTAAGMGLVWRYSLTPGVSGNAPANWPAQSHIPRQRGALTLVTWVHPRCPCSRASLGELAILMAQAREPITAYAVFVRPPGLAIKWGRSDLWDNAGAIPGVTRVIDDNGREARLFGASTSGQTAVYDGQGRLRFSGGITAARGHWGDNPGVRTIIALADNPRQHETARTAVYGCPLFTPGTPCRRLISCASRRVIGN